MFELEIEYEFEDFLRWQKLYKKLHGKVKRAVMCVLVIAYALFMVGLSVWDIYWFGYVGFLNVLLIVLAALLVLLLLLTDRLNAKKAQKMYLNKNEKQYCRVDDEGIYYKASSNEGRYLHTGVKALYKDDKRVYVIVGDQQASILPFRCLTTGTAEQLCAFLSEKTGLEIKNNK